MQTLTEKWNPVLNHEDAPKITDSYRADITAQLLENTATSMKEQYLAEAGVTNTSTSLGSASNGAYGVNTAIDPVLISLVRRSMPNLIAFDVAGVQAMKGPTGLIFAMQPKFSPGTSSESDAFVTGVDGRNQIQTSFSSGGTKGYTGTGISTALGEGTVNGEMGFDITRTSVVAKTRQLRSGYTLELAQDLKAVHGLNAETELANILTTEILAEINREVIGTINAAAQSAGSFSLVTDADGRWAVEKFKSLAFKLEQEANTIAKRTRRGKGNIIICSSNVASALAASGQLDYAPGLSTKLNVDDTGNTFAGVLNGRLKVYVDPYAASDYVTIGFRGTNQYDAGIFYCPYVPLQMVRAVDPTTFQPAIAFKTRYGIVANPFVEAYDATYKGLSNNTNPYYRNLSVSGINVGEQNT
jgi:hypothetical protein